MLRKGKPKPPTACPQEMILTHILLRFYARFPHHQRIGGSVKRFFLALGLFLATMPGSAQSQLLSALPIDGIRCESMEGAVVHIHEHLVMYDRGRQIAVPANIGIPAGQGCLYWLHTHGYDGVIHNEVPIRRTFVLGQFFDVWGGDLSWTQAGPLHAARGKRISVTVNGRIYRGRDPRDILLTDHEEILIQSGPPWVRTVKKMDWRKL